MFLKFFKLREQAFGVTPNPRFLYQSATHREALASLIYAIESDLGFSLLIAPPGMGKTTLLFHLLERYRSAADTALVFQTQCDSLDLLRYVLLEFGVQPAGDFVALHEQFQGVLLNGARQGRRILVVVDEAQNLGPEVLETVRLLSDFETPERKLLHVILSGQPQLAGNLNRPELRQLVQRVATLSRLEPFSPEEVAAYIEHRLKAAGYDGAPIFSARALQQIAELSEGIPRKINLLCFHALSLGYVMDREMLDSDVVLEAAADLDLTSLAGGMDSWILPQPLASIGPPRRNSVAVDSAASFGRHPLTSSLAPATSARMATWQPATVAQGETSRIEPVAPITSPRSEPSLSTPVLGAAAISVVEDKLKNEWPNRQTESVTPKPYSLEEQRSFGLMWAPLLAMVMICAGAAYIYADQLLAFVSLGDPAAPVSEPAQSEPKKVARPPRRQTPQARRAAAKPATASVSTAPRTALNVTPVPPGIADQSLPQSSAELDAAETQPVQPVPVAPVKSAAPVPVRDAASIVTPITTVESVSLPVGASIPPKIVHRVQPSYPERARREGIVGRVVMTAIVRRDGSVSELYPEKGHPVLVKAASRAIRTWRFEPALSNGQPIDSTMTIEVNFSGRE